MDRLGDYYDRRGHQLTLRQWSELLGDSDYKRVASTRWGNRWVSTVWLGLDHGFGWYGDVPITFESMAFVRGSWAEHDMDRYPTEEAARRGHREMVRRFIAPVRRHCRAGAAIGVGLVVLAFALIAASTGGVT